MRERKRKNEREYFLEEKEGHFVRRIEQELKQRERKKEEK